MRIVFCYSDYCRPPLSVCTTIAKRHFQVDFVQQLGSRGWQPSFTSELETDTLIPTLVNLQIFSLPSEQSGAPLFGNVSDRESFFCPILLLHRLLYVSLLHSSGIPPHYRREQLMSMFQRGSEGLCRLSQQLTVITQRSPSGAART